jgi:hypothetical protein
MDGKIEQYICIKLCMKLDKSATATLEMLREAFGEHSSSWTTVFEWHSRLKAGQASAEDDKRSGQPSTSKMTESVEEIRGLVQEDCCRTIHELADTVGVSYGACQEILAEYFNMCRIAMKFVPRLLTNDQKQRHINVCLELQEKAN